MEFNDTTIYILSALVPIWKNFCSY